MHDPLPPPVPLLPIPALQGSGLLSPYAGRTVRLRGVVTGHSHKGYFLQDPAGPPDPHTSCGIFVYSPARKARVGLLLEVEGRVLDYIQNEGGRPTTQIKAFETRPLPEAPPRIEPVWLTAETLPTDMLALAQMLNGLESMLVGIPAGSTFAAPSNPFGDYVCIPPGLPGLRSPQGGLLVDPARPHRWLPGFRVIDYARAPQVHVGASLLAPVVGPLNYRSEAYQIAALGDVQVGAVSIARPTARLMSTGPGTTVLTLNGFNLDVQVERAQLVKDPDRDIDDDVLYGRFELLARAIVAQAGSPDIVALQEIQDNDGAELSAMVDASATYRQLVRDIRRVGGPQYRWADLPPEPDADGGQPGGNIRNGYLYNPARVELRRKTLRRIGAEHLAFVGSRKPLLAHFEVLGQGADLVVVNVHLASKRHQHSAFAPELPGFDPKEPLRIAQAEVIREALAECRSAGLTYYVTGDFNDFEFSPTLAALCGEESVNLVQTLPPEQRFDYNHRGQLQVLMHGVVPRAAQEEGRAEYEILHGNELQGVDPGGMEGKASDHAYVLARIQVSGPATPGTPPPDPR